MIELNRLTITIACELDSSELTDISFSAKRYWNYPDNYFDIWNDELTISVDYINHNIVYKAVYQDTTIGFYSIVENKSDFYSGEIFVSKGFWLEHIFIRPKYHKFGIGRRLISHASNISINKGIEKLLIFVEPNARGFYDNIGADYLYDSKSSIPNRMIPVYELQCKQIN